MGNIDAEKLKAIESAMSHIEKQFGKGSVMKLGDHEHKNIDVVQCFEKIIMHKTTEL